MIQGKCGHRMCSDNLNLWIMILPQVSGTFFQYQSPLLFLFSTSFDLKKVSIMKKQIPKSIALAFYMCCNPET